MGRFIELGCSLANISSLEFHSNDANTTAVNYDTRIYSSGGTTGSIGQGVLYYAAKTHNFDNTIKIGTKTVATTDLLTVYATKAGATFTGVITFPTSMSLGITTTVK